MDVLPGEIKNSSSLTVFKNKIRKWTPAILSRIIMQVLSDIYNRLIYT